MHQLCSPHLLSAEPCVIKGDSAVVLQIHNALSRVNKEQTVEKLERAFEQSAIVYGMRFKNLSVSLCASAAHF